ncbi:MAG TPA: magnesium-translocating P-type ATPase [Actinocrinis sp.]|uniref:magnesium-translocating P-type ATPase n=1 Tax=Actinocrinis sp. TaxID=1920516 RepID=UPI002DDCAADE|nr:magnesium-translocating P-type ATPase [Actinocrinis sp.]HEV2346673.1 magnesium-translocating P-type ATPase [Actinocrinis sp.]
MEAARAVPALSPGESRPVVEDDHLIRGDPHALGTMPCHQLLRTLQTSPRGLTERDAERRASAWGDNTLRTRTMPHGAHRLLAAARDPFVLLLAVIAAVAALTRSPASTAVIMVAVVIGCVLRVRQEARGQRAVAALRTLVGASASVLRRAEHGALSRVREVPIEHLVPGDIVQLHPGDFVPADLYLLRSDGLTLSEGALTGESRLAAKTAAPVTGPDPSAAEQTWLCRAGARVAHGTATAVVIATGADTVYGAAHDALAGPGAQPATAYERGVASITRLLLVGSVLTGALVFAVLAATRGMHAEALLFGLAVATGLTPEMLPVVTTGVLFAAARELGRHGTAVRRLAAVHNLGAIDVLCIDKTGTLTLGRPTVAACLDAEGRAAHPDRDDSALTWARAVSAAVLAHAPGLVDALDEALLDAYDGAHRFEVLDVLPFDPVRRRASALLCEPGRLGGGLLAAHGAVPDILEACDSLLRHGEQAPLDPATRERLLGLAEAHATRYERLLAVAIRPLHGRPRTRPLRPADERRLTLAGFVVLRDRPRAEARGVLSRLADAGVETKVVTGDIPEVVAAVCAELGLGAGRIVTGADIDACDAAELRRLVSGARVFAQATPAHKALIVGALRDAGRATGFLGDGVNDAPALRAADVGLSLPEAADVARECADVVLGPGGLHALPDVITAGRGAAVNTAKYLKITLSSNAGNVLSTLAAALVLPFLPMLPLQILVQNLAFDLAQLALTTDRTDPAAAARPRRFDRHDLVRFTLLFAPLGTLADLATFHALAPHGAAGPGAQALFRAGWFAENLLTQACAILLLRSRHSFERRSRARGALFAATTALAALALFLPLGPLAASLGLAPPPPRFYPLLAAIVAGFCVLVAAAKAGYARAGHAVP